MKNEKSNKSIGRILNVEQSEIVAFLDKLSGGSSLDNGNLILKDGLGSDKSEFKGMINRNDGHYCKDLGTSDKAWIEFDFRERKIHLSSYEIKTCNRDEGPKSWQILGSNDEVNWTVLSNQMNRMETKGLCVFSKFECTKNENYYRFIRFNILDTWNTEHPKYYIHFQYLGLFGLIVEPISNS